MAFLTTTTLQTKTTKNFQTKTTEQQTYGNKTHLKNSGGLNFAASHVESCC